MNTPPSLLAWLDKKVATTRWASVTHPRTVTHNWRLATGGRVMQAELAASIVPSVQFSLEVEAEGIEEEFSAGATDGAITVLLSQSYTPVLAIALRLYDFKPYENDSSYAAFYNAAKRATERLLGVAGEESHNIAW
jgi:hypothetical protein